MIIKNLKYLFIFFIPMVIFAGDDAEKLLASVQKKYKEMKDLSLEFTQETQSVFSKETLMTMGSLRVKKGNKYRLELERQIVVTDGVTLWTYLKPDNSVLVDRYREGEQALSPEKLFTSLPGKFSAEKAGTEKIGAVQTQILLLTPKEKSASIREMKIWIDEKALLIKKIYLFDVSNNRITYFLDEIKFNSGLKDSTFTFEPLPDTEILDLR